MKLNLVEEEEEGRREKGGGRREEGKGRRKEGGGKREEGGEGGGERREKRERGERREVKEGESIYSPTSQPFSYTTIYGNLTVIKHSCTTIHTTCRSPSL